MFENIDPTLIWTFAIIYSVLLFSSTVIFVMKLKGAKGSEELVARVKTWWIIAVVLTIVVFAGRTASIVFFAFISFLALKEYFSLISTRRADRRVLFWAYLSIPIQFYWIYLEWYGMFIIFIPVYIFLFLPMRMILIGETEKFLSALARIHWGVMTAVFCISHAAYLLVLDFSQFGKSTGSTMLIYLVILTQFNDIFQYLWGKLLGAKKVVPKVSPNKTVAGLIGGVGSTLLLSWVLAPYLTPLNELQSLFAGLIIGLGGFIGDVTISALKRDIGAKDSGSLLPGHGGILDRVDSLFYTAPIFFHYTFYIFFPPLVA